MIRSRSHEHRAGSEANPRLEYVAADLRSANSLAEALEGVDGVIHAAAVKGGDIYAQFAGTVVGTENLLAAMQNAGVCRLVLVSTFSVYDYSRLWSHSRLDESAPIISLRNSTRDGYAQSKRQQEQLVRAFEDRGGNVTIIRPGVIYGRENTWTARLGICGSGPLWIRVGNFSRLPLTYVENCAEAVVLSVESQDAIGKTFNCVDDDAPTQRRYARLLQKRTPGARLSIVIPWRALWLMACLAELTNRLLCQNRAKLPGLLRCDALESRFKPLRFDNALIKRTLGWRPRVALEDALDRCLLERKVMANSAAGALHSRPLAS
jgi:nucleoside-diphosphate-sugar epimerase